MPYLESIGAVEGISDAVAGSMCWCPITNLDYASEAYEWNLGVTRDGLSDEMQQPTFYSLGKRQLRIVNLQGGESIGIYDTLGRQRASRKAYGESEEFELESGVYMIRIEGSSLVKGKVVVK